MVVHKGETVYARAAGLSDRAAGIAMHEDQIFRLASVTKPYVAAATMRLAEDGRLDLDSEVTRYLPDFRPPAPDGSRPTITLRQLLSHTSGLSVGFMGPAGNAYHVNAVSDGLDQPGLSMAENLRSIGETPLLFRPGTARCYSVGLDVLGAALEVITDLPLPGIVDRLVTAPLGMTDTAFAVKDPARLAKAYAGTPDGPIEMYDGIEIAAFKSFARLAPSRILNPASFASGGSGMAGTAADVTTFLEAMRLGGGPILRPATVADMRRNQGVPGQCVRPGSGSATAGTSSAIPPAARRPRAWARCNRAASTVTTGSWTQSMT